MARDGNDGGFGREENPRRAVPGEVCPCGRQAREVYTNPNGTEIGYCGLWDRGLDKSGPCPFCGGKWPEYGICPLYQIRPLVKGASQTQTQTQGQQPNEQDEQEEQDDQAEQPDGRSEEGR